MLVHAGRPEARHVPRPGGGVEARRQEPRHGRGPEVLPGEDRNPLVGLSQDGKTSKVGGFVCLKIEGKFLRGQI